MNINPDWITGFVDGEGCFHVCVNPHNEMSVGFQVLPEFTVVQHKRDIQLLYGLKEYFKCGVVRSNHGDRMAYRVRGIEHLLQIIIPFFVNHPLKSKKRIAFEKFKTILMMISRKEHLKASGVEEIKSIAKQINIIQ